MGKFGGIAIPLYFSTSAATWGNLSSFTTSIPKWYFKAAATTCNGAIPTLSPRPFTVVWIIVAPPSTAAKAFATAIPKSLWACMSNSTPGTSLTKLEKSSLVFEG